MLEIIFNDATNNLSLVAINGDECFKVLDYQCNICAEMHNNGFDFKRVDFLDLWITATDVFFNDTIDEPDHKKHLEEMKKMSFDSFADFLVEQFMKEDDDE